MTLYVCTMMCSTQTQYILLQWGPLYTSKTNFNSSVSFSYVFICNYAKQNNACNCHPIQHQTSFYTVCITAMMTIFYRYHFSDTNAYHCTNICTNDPHHLNYGHRTFPFSDIHTLIVLLLIMQGHRCKQEAGGEGGRRKVQQGPYHHLFNTF